jgi:hypothetical protein
MLDSGYKVNPCRLYLILFVAPVSEPDAILKGMEAILDCLFPYSDPFQTFNSLMQTSGTRCPLLLTLRSAQYRVPSHPSH